MRITGSINPHSFLSALEAESPEPLVIDLSSVTFIEPVGLVGLAAVAQRARDNGRDVSLVTPTNHSVANYLSRMQVGGILDGLGATHALPTVKVTPHPTELLELQSFSGQGGGEAVATLVFDKLEAVGADLEVRQTLYEGICEVAANVEFHAGVSHGYVAAQTTHGGSRVFFAIADAGQGLKASLSESYEIPDDAQAVAAAVMPEVSGTGEKGRGQGLPSVVSSSVGLSGYVDIASGNARSRHSRQNVVPNTTVGGFPGTIIQVQLDCSPGR